LSRRPLIVGMCCPDLEFIVLATIVKIRQNRRSISEGLRTRWQAPADPILYLRDGNPNVFRQR
jgi:hypothetical protein